MTEWSVICDCDQHFDQDGNTRKGPPNRSVVIMQTTKTLNPEILLNVGDITAVAPQSGCLWTCKNSKMQNAAVQYYLSKYYLPISGPGSVEIKMCAGNHDDNSATNSMIKDKHGASEYTFDHRGVRFICLGIFPKNLAFLSSVLSKTTKDMPVVIYYHFNTVPKQPYADWWSDAQKTAFYQAVQSYRIVAIVNGHWHATNISRWNGVLCVIAGASEIVALKFKDSTYTDVLVVAIPGS